VDPSRICSERTPGGGADEHHPKDSGIPQPTTASGCFTQAFARVGGEPGALRLTVILRREGWRVNPQRIYRLYTEDGLTVRTKLRKKLARRSRVPMPRATGPNQKWSMDFMSAKVLDGRWFRVLTLIDQFTRECLALVADRVLNGHRVALALSRVVAERGTPESITADNGSEFASRAMDAWTYQYGVRMEFIRPGKPIDNGYIESFNGRLRD
jgi:putative transposase